MRSETERNESEDEGAPGLRWRGSRAYWIARPDLVKKGYRPKLVRLHYKADDPALVTRCQALQAEMLRWARDEKVVRRAVDYDGTFLSLVTFYEEHDDSPYHDLHPNTQKTYSKTMKALMRDKGKRRVDAVDGSDVRRWYKELEAVTSKSWAYYTISVLKGVLSFGATKRIKEAAVLRAELREARFGNGKGRTEQITYEQVVAFCEKARELGHDWMGRCLLLQFEFGMRRRDVIGEWIRAEDDARDGGIRARRRVWHNGTRVVVWRDGLTWNHIDSDGVLKKMLSKTAKTSEAVAVHTIADHPDLVAELARTPLEKRIGPLVIFPPTGVPPTEAHCRRFFRIIARAAGIPDAVWNMDARAGANTESFNADVTKDQRMAHLGQTQEKTNDRYIREVQQKSGEAARKRVASR